jgi:hypothetical protein
LKAHLLTSPVRRIAHLAMTELPDELLKLTLNLAGDWRFKAVVWTPRMSGPTTGSKQRVQRRIRLRCLAPAQIRIARH